jgi:hypothetical protein
MYTNYVTNNYMLHTHFSTIIGILQKLQLLCSALNIRLQSVVPY